MKTAEKQYITAAMLLIVIAAGFYAGCIGFGYTPKIIAPQTGRFALQLQKAAFAPIQNCSTDTDCASRGPGFACNTTNNQCEWQPPIGIPKLEFGIEETYRMYDDPANRNPILTYTQNEEGGFYTHYVDWTASGATDSSNSYGSIAKPRKTVPWNLPEGSVVEVHDTTGAGYTSGSAPHGTYWTWFSGSGSAEHPIFIRGADAPVFAGMRLRTGGTYLVIEDFEFRSSSITFHSAYVPQLWNHISIRNMHIHDGNSGYIRVTGTSSGAAADIVIYNNHIHHNGNIPYRDSHDLVAVQVEDYSERVWVVDNHIHHNDGDSIQLNAGGGSRATVGWPKYVYIGRNELHEDRENAIDLKDSEHVIISQNRIYGYYNAAHGDRVFGNDPNPRPVHGSDGTSILPSNEGCYSSWLLFNEIYDSTNANRVDNELAANVDAHVYLIGNIIHDIDEYGVITWERSWLTMVGNTFYNVGRGFDSYSGSANNEGQSIYKFYNNIFSTITGSEGNHRYIELGSEPASANAVIENNLFYGGVGLKWGNSTYATLAAFIAGEPGKGTGCIEADPLFVDAANNNFNLQSTSPAIDTGIESEAYQIFYDLYGIDIRKDIKAKIRPQGSGWDIGAYEYLSGETPTCSGTDTSCGTYPNCQNCNNSDGCNANSYRNYSCLGTNCTYTEDNCTDCSCSCGNFNTTESTANNNCQDGKDNDCDGTTDSADSGCQPQQECTQDSNCTQGKICCSQQCTTPACTINSDCDDGDSCTTDKCNATGTCTAECTNENITSACTTDSDCDDGDSCTTDKCNATGTCTAECTNENITNCGKTTEPSPEPAIPKGNLTIKIEGRCLGQPITVTALNEKGNQIANAEIKAIKDGKTVETKKTGNTGKISITLTQKGEYLFYTTKQGYYADSQRIQITECPLPTISYKENIETGQQQTITLKTGNGTTIKDFNLLLVYPDMTTETLSTTEGTITIPIGKTGTYQATIQTSNYESTFSFEAKNPYQLVPPINQEAKPAVQQILGKETAEQSNYLIIWILAIAIISGLIIEITKLKPGWFRIFMATTYTAFPIVLSYYTKNTWITFAIIAMQTTILTALYFKQWKTKKILKNIKKTWETP